jgi:hypothetical protein
MWHGDPAPNQRLRQARLRMPSPSGSGRPLSRQELADQANEFVFGSTGREACLDANYIGKLERGEHRWPNDLYRRALRAVLDAAKDSDLGFFIIRSSPGTALTAVPGSDVGHQAVDTPGAVDERRRSLLRGIAIVLAASGLFQRGTTTGQRRIGTADVARLDAVTALYRATDYECGGGLLYVEVGRFAESASALLGRPLSGSTRERLLASVACARQLAGWTAFDAGKHSDAQRHWLSAERAAVAAGDVRLAARIRYCQARQFQHLRHNQDALDTVRLAQAQLSAAATPALSAMLQGTEAASLAALEHKEEALSALGQASAHFERIDPDREPDWMRYFDHGEVLAQYGRVHRDLARVDQASGEDAVGWVSNAIAALGAQQIRSSVLNEVGLCSALFLADDPAAGIEAGNRVIEHADQLNSQRVVDRIHNLRRDLTNHLHRPDVADFSQRLALVGTSGRGS